ncbi:MAG TPA: BsuPI-related putative proteinase inhibitor [Bacillus sp. (in: firmicutes)]|uniref:BsuPI-related putative proteinase inhibitor n=1 Tax=Bacillus litorisediminis TaxID=2922713 RepID=UPI001FAF5987|nr:BsuPI-related putative proteinase inhibitor [Bacillus litorisediminis]HWO75057.1 BsuPI-related putative proteinase inhibitor [Bacillus sp. (in: firmicutes)]
MKKTLIYLVMTSLLISFIPSQLAMAIQPSFGLALDIHVRPGTEQTEMEIVLQNRSNQKRELIFTTSQVFEIQITNPRTKETVYTYSANKSFLQAIQRMVLQPKEVRRWKETWEYAENGKVPQGEHVVKLTLLAKTVDKKPLDHNQRSIVKQVFFPEVNPTVTDISVQRNYDGFLVSGTVEANGHDLYFTLDDGHRVLIPEKRISVRQDHFYFLVPNNEIPLGTKGTLVLTIYTKNTRYLPYVIPLEV